MSWKQEGKLVFAGTIWNFTVLEDRGTELERNEFQFKGWWNGTEQVPVHSWVERNGTSSKKFGTEYNTGRTDIGLWENTLREYSHNPISVRPPPRHSYWNWKREFSNNISVVENTRGNVETIWLGGTHYMIITRMPLTKFLFNMQAMPTKAFFWFYLIDFKTF